MMMNHLGRRAVAQRVKGAYNAVLSSGRPELKTPHTGGTGRTREFAEAMVERLKA